MSDSMRDREGWKIVEGWLRDNRGFSFPQGSIDDLTNRIDSALCQAPATPASPMVTARDLIELIADIPLWRDTYPDGPDQTGAAIGGRHAQLPTVTPDQVRKARSLLTQRTAEHMDDKRGGEGKP